jgi:hypothetical protein
MGLSLFYVGCSEMGQAADWAARAIEQRDTKMTLLIALLRAYSSNILRSDSRWSAIARTLRVPLAVVDD